MALPGAGIRVLSRDRSVSKPELIVVFRQCEAYRYRDASDAEWGRLLEPIVREHNPYGVTSPDLVSMSFAPRGYPVTWKNVGEDVEVRVSSDSFRTNTPWASDQDDYVLVARDPQATAVSVTWSLTEDGSDDRGEDELEVTTGDVIDARLLLKQTFFQED